MEELREHIFEYLQAHPKGKRKLDDIQEGLGLTSSSDFAALSRELDAMEADYEVFRSPENQYETRDQAGVLEGKISINRAGLGYVDREDRDSIKIDLKDQNTALDGDRVLVKCQPW